MTPRRRLLDGAYQAPGKVKEKVSVTAASADAAENARIVKAASDPMLRHPNKVLYAKPGFDIHLASLLRHK